jgi:hypothetical protein
LYLAAADFFFLKRWLKHFIFAFGGC